jgi:hypothetical protein
MDQPAIAKLGSVALAHPKRRPQFNQGAGALAQQAIAGEAAPDEYAVACKVTLTPPCATQRRSSRSKICYLSAARRPTSMAPGSIRSRSPMKPPSP